MFPSWLGIWLRVTLCWSDFWLENLCTLRSRRHDLLPCLRADRWPNDNVHRLLIKGLTRLHDEKRMKDAFTDNNIKRQKNYLKGIP